MVGTRFVTLIVICRLTFLVFVLACIAKRKPSVAKIIHSVSTDTVPVLLPYLTPSHQKASLSLVARPSISTSRRFFLSSHTLASFVHVGLALDI